MKKIISLLIMLTLVSCLLSDDCFANDNKTAQTTRNTKTNFIDKAGLKQGIWRTSLNGKLWKEENYLDNKLHGKCIEYLENRDIEETNYVNGIRHGYFLHYNHDSTFALFVTYWQNGIKIWSAFPWELKDYIIPIKGFITEKDSIEVNVPYNSGKLMYQGVIVSKKGSNPIAVGLHKVYYETGELKAIVDYNKDSVKIFRLDGELIVNTTIENWKYHRIE